MTRPVRARQLTAWRARPRRPGRRAGQPETQAGPPGAQAGPPGTPAENVQIEVHATATVTTVVVKGDLDVIGTPRLAARLAPVLAGRPQRLVLDLAQAGYIDCAAARLIVGTAQSLPGRPVIRSPGVLARRVLELTGLDGDCEIEMPAVRLPPQRPAAP